MTYNELSSLCRATVLGLLILSLLLLPAWGAADLYYWTDGEGVKHFSNEPPVNRSGGLRKTDEYVQDDPIDKKSLDLPKVSDDRKKP